MTAKLRGRLPLALDARLLERAARTPCQRYRASVVAGTDPDRVLAASRGADAVPEGSGAISPFARSIGIAFERRVMGDSAKLLGEVYQEALGWSPSEVLDLRPFLEKGKAEIAEERTAEVIEHRLATGEGPDLVLGARVSLTTAAGTVHIRPDFLVARTGRRSFRVGEVKSYLDLDGRTDASEIGTAVRQAAVGVLAVRSTFGEEACERHVDLVLRAPRKIGVSVRTLDASAEIANISTFLGAMEGEAEITAALTAGLALSEPGAIDVVPHHFDSSCEDRCAFFSVCHEEAVASDEPALLGEAAAAALEGVSTVGRAMELARGAEPLTEDERRVASALSAAWSTSEAVERLMQGAAGS